MSKLASSGRKLKQKKSKKAVEDYSMSRYKLYYFDDMIEEIIHLKQSVRLSLPNQEIFSPTNMRKLKTK